MQQIISFTLPNAEPLTLILTHSQLQSYQNRAIRFILTLSATAQQVRRICSLSLFHLDALEAQAFHDLLPMQPCTIVLKADVAILAELARRDILSADDAVGLLCSDAGSSLLQNMLWYLLACRQSIALPDDMEGSLETGFTTRYQEQDDETDEQAVAGMLNGTLDENWDIEHMLSGYQLAWQRIDGSYLAQVPYDTHTLTVALSQEQERVFTCVSYYDYALQNAPAAIYETMNRINASLSIGTFFYDDVAQRIGIRTAIDAGTPYLPRYYTDRLFIGCISLAQSYDADFRDLAVTA